MTLNPGIAEQYEDDDGFSFVDEKPILNFFSWIERIAAVFFFAAIYVGVMIQAAQRYLPVSPWQGAGELARYSLVGLTLITIGYLIGQHRHIRIDLIDNVLPPRVLSLVKGISYAIIAAISIAFLLESFALIESLKNAKTTSLQIPYSVVYAISAFAFAMGSVRSIQLTVVNVIQTFRPLHSRPASDSAA
jgi:TRAP-type C4-dicarboxylate transport system permease small subunit